MLKPFALYFSASLLLYFLLSGCGSNNVTSSPGLQSQPLPGAATPTSGIVWAINDSAWPQSDFTQAVSDVNAQLSTVGQYYGIVIQIQIATSAPAGQAQVLVSANPNPPGVAANGVTFTNPGVACYGGSAYMNYTEVLAEQGTSGSPEDYFSHASLLAAYGAGVGETYEQYAYGLVNGQPSQIPQNLCDWALPAGGAVSPITGVLSLDYAGYVPVTVAP